MKLTQITVVTGIADKRYRVLVNLMRSDRPRYWTFNCHNCKASVIHLQNVEVVSLDDFYDPQNLNYAGPVKDCKGRESSGMACPYTYFFRLH